MNQFAALRTVAGSFMVDTCTIADASSIVFDPELGYETDTAGAAIYSGKCRIRPASGPAVVMAGEATRSFGYFDVWVPYDTTGVERDHLLTITASEDPHLLDRQFVVTNVEGGSDGAHRKLQVQDTLTVTPEEVGS